MLLFIFSNAFSQKKKNSEYRYLAFKFFATHNISFPPGANDNVLIKTPYGDMIKKNHEAFSYTPGGGASIIFNYDFKNEKLGVVLGIDIQNYGFKNHYMSLSENYLVTNRYRTLQIGIPIFFKWGFYNIYKNQSYITFGVQLNQYFNTLNIQTASWNVSPYIKKLPKEELMKTSIAGILGFNYGVYFVNVQFLTANFMNKKYEVTTAEGVVAPYKHLNIMNNLYIQTGFNIPLTRWLSARNWPAERVRRVFSKAK